jgi:uncharacterized protein (TIGR03435 family)
MFVEALFWFHPLVWWIGARLVAERERACDEDVLRQGNAPRAYAESILTVCRHYLESPLPCAAGVTGADLKRRVEEILLRRHTRRLTAARKAILATAALSAIISPIAIGVLRAQNTAYKFEVASVRLNKSGDRNVRINPGPQGGIRTTNTSLLGLITFAYGMREFQVSGGPSWIANDRWDIVATPDIPEEVPGPGNAKKMSRDAFEGHLSRQRIRVQNLLAERFQLVMRQETKEMPVYALAPARSGHKLKLAADDRGPSMRTNHGLINAKAIPMAHLCSSLSGLLQRPVFDETGLKGSFDFDLEWTPDHAEGQSGSLFTAIQDKLGLKLDSRRAPASVWIIEKAERPAEN